MNIISIDLPWKQDKKGLGVYEIYPYAIYKFLAYLKMRGLLQQLNSDRFDTLLDDGFRSYWPPKYKREREKGKRLENMNSLYWLLTDSNLGLKFSAFQSLPYPNPHYTLSELDMLCDGYDACLGALVGIYFVNRSSYACIAGDSNSGNILLLADRWLLGRLGKEVRVYQPKELTYEIGN